MGNLGEGDGMFLGKRIGGQKGSILACLDTFLFSHPGAGSGDVPTSKPVLIREAKFFSLSNGLFYFLLFALLLRQQLNLLDYFEFGDESETLVAAKMMAAGMRLYSDFFNHHGPLIFLPGLLLEKTGDYAIHAHRIYIMLLQWMALYAVYRSPLIAAAPLRIVLTAATGLVFVVFMPHIFGHMVLYQTVAGLLLLICLVQYTLPAWRAADLPNRAQVILGSALIGLLPFLAVTYLPAAGALFLISLRKRYWRVSLVALLCTIALCLLYTGWVGSLRGYWAYHFYLNLRIMPGYSHVNGLTDLFRMIGDVVLLENYRLVIPTLFVAAVVVFDVGDSVGKGRFSCWRGIILMLFFIGFLVRGNGFHTLPYYYAACALPLFFVYAVPGRAPVESNLFYPILPILGLLIVLLAVRADRAHFASRHIEVASQFGELAKILTGQNDRVLVYTFQNFQYLAADRLPASGAFFYLPWQAKYNKQPVLGIRHDPCEDIARNKPKLIFLDRWKVWDIYDWSDYASCVDDAVAADYLEVGNPFAQGQEKFYIHKDFYQPKLGVALASEQWQIVPTGPLEAKGSLPLTMWPGYLDRAKALKRIGVRLLTYGKTPSGQAGLHLTGPNGAVFNQTFDLSAVRDARYHFFDLDAGFYDRGELRFLTGGEIAVVRSNPKSSDETPVACMVYEYSDGERSFTPGCPFL